MAVGIPDIRHKKIQTYSTRFHIAVRLCVKLGDGTNVNKRVLTNTMGPYSANVKVGLFRFGPYVFDIHFLTKIHRFMYIRNFAWALISLVPFSQTIWQVVILFLFYDRRKVICF